MKNTGRQIPPVVFPLLAMLIFVFMHSFMPTDPRARMGFKPFEVEWGVSPAEVWYAVQKWRHIVWFALFFPLVRTLFARHASAKAFATILAATMLIEFQQAFINGRHARLVDVLPNLIGAALGIWLWSRPPVVRWRARHARRVPWLG